AFGGGIDIQASGQMGRLIRDNADRLAAHPSKTNDYVAGEMFRDLKEIGIVHHSGNHVLDVVWLVRFGRDQRIELFVSTILRVPADNGRHAIQVILRQEAHQLTNTAETILIVSGQKVSDAAYRVVGHRAAKVFLGDIFMSDSLNHVGTG